MLPLPSVLVDYLKSLLQRKPEERVFRIHRDTVTHVFSEAVKEAGLTEGVSDPSNRLAFHSLRHGFTTALVELNISTARAARLTRHKDLAMFKRYEHLNPEALRQEVEALAKRFFPDDESCALSSKIGLYT